MLDIETSIKYDTFRKTGLYTSKHRPDGRNGYYRKYQTSVQDSVKGSGIYVSVMFPGNMFNNGTSHTIHNEKRDIAYFAAGPLFSGIGAK